MAKNIVLTGFMGVGKGQIGRALSACTSMFVVDCDDLIESAANKKIKKIFADDGEKTFRQQEVKIAKWLENNVKKTIISTGGGFVNVPNLKKIGQIVYLHDDFDKIIDRMSSHPNSDKKFKKRPLLADIQKAKKLYKNRLEIYRKSADVIINMNNKTIEEVVSEICKSCRL